MEKHEDIMYESDVDCSGFRKMASIRILNSEQKGKLKKMALDIQATKLIMEMLGYFPKGISSWNLENRQRNFRIIQEEYSEAVKKSEEFIAIIVDG